MNGEPINADIRQFAITLFPHPPQCPQVCGDEPSPPFTLTPVAELYFCPVCYQSVCAAHLRANHLPLDRHFAVLWLTQAIKGLGDIVPDLGTQLRQRAFCLDPALRMPTPAVELPSQIAEVLAATLHELETMALSLVSRRKAIQTNESEDK